MDTRHLKAFLAVFEERNITLAAQRLFITQPTLSVTIRQLEDDLATPLFIREPRGVAVTEAARLLYPQAQRLLAQLAGIRQQFTAQHHCQPLALGVAADVPRQAVNYWLAVLAGALPAVQWQLQAGCAGDVRLAAEAERCEDELFLPLLDDPLCVVAPRDWPQDKPIQQLHDIALDDWILCPDAPSQQQLLALLGVDTVAMQTNHRANTLPLVLQLVEAGQGWALVPASLAADYAVQPVTLAQTLPSIRYGLCYRAALLEQPILNQAVAALSAAPVFMATPRSA
ncbi:LysR family transcriptional regulator [Chitinibacter tainanensis]|uniref:LysR family transcriptional regulator n=1 Tax=Chitinibacter tainanensis TaxID=230667 RepID=UPI0003FEF4D6|nr:LysR family transcriptional regulator [Chitinibacter tainanensis]